MGAFSKSPRLLVFLAFCLPLVGCSPKFVEVDDEIVTRVVDSKEITAIHYMPETQLCIGIPDTAHEMGLIGAGLLGGLIGGVIYDAAVDPDCNAIGEEFIQNNWISDPVNIFKQRFLYSLHESHEGISIIPIKEPFPDDNPERLQDEFTNQLVFDFRTITWGVSSKSSSHADSAPVLYGGRIRLLAFPEGEILWEENCPTPGEAQGNIYELTENQGELLQKRLVMLAKNCARMFSWPFKRKKVVKQ